VDTNAIPTHSLVMAEGIVRLPDYSATMLTSGAGISLFTPHRYEPACFFLPRPPPRLTRVVPKGTQPFTVGGQRADEYGQHL
jgi:hypothetical protein